jgi:16S rRNA C1402 N4-methylase RsmH
MNGSKAIFPSKEEVESNPKSRSARLRFLTKIKQPEL